MERDTGALCDVLRASAGIACASYSEQEHARSVSTIRDSEVIEIEAEKVSEKII